jgi:Ca2+-binding EF-hand superfamily protein
VNIQRHLAWTRLRTLEQGESLSRATVQFDANEDNRLEWSEFRALCNAADFALSDEESKKAVELLDKRKSGYVEFDEFASWWVSKGSPLDAAEKEAGKKGATATAA